MLLSPDAGMPPKGTSPVHIPDVYLRLLRARELMDDCYNEPLDIEQLAKEACISPYHFIRLFKDTFEKTPHQYLISRRIERAKTILASSDRSVTDVCFDVGFQSVGSFSSLFSKIMGASPLSYRIRVYQTLHLPLIEVPANIPCCFLIKHRLQQEAGL